MKNWIRKLTVAILILSIGATAGCGKQQEEPKKPSQIQLQGQENVAKGRYLETEIELPEDLAEATLAEFSTGADGKMEFMSVSYQDDGTLAKAPHYIFDGTDWLEKDSSWILQLLEQESLSLWNLCCGQDGRYYVGGLAADKQYHLFRSGENGYQEILEEVFLPENQDTGNQRGMRPTGMEVNGDGDILLIDMEKAHLYRPDGTFAFTMEQDARYNSSQMGTRMFYTDEFITFLDGDIVRYELKEGTITETIPCEDRLAGEEGNGIIIRADDGGIFLAGRNGFSHISRGASLWEQMIDGNLTTMGMQNLYLAGWAQGNEDDFYGIFMGEFSDGIKVFRYVYDADITAVPPVTLMVYSLNDVASVHQAASLMQKNNPDVRVEYRVASKEGEEAVQEDVIRSLNMELLNGRGADILLLDGLPADTYQEKGILMDMRELFADMDEKTPLLPFVVENFTEPDGSVYQMPIRLSFPAGLGEPDALEAMQSLRGMKDYRGSLPLLSRNNYENIMRMVANLRYEELWGNGDEVPDEETIITYLEAVKAIGEQNGAKTEFTRAELENPVGIGYYGNNASVRGMEETPVGYDSGEALAAVMEFQSVYSTTLSWGVAKKHTGMQPQSFDGIYFPLSLVGINQASGQKDAAEEFVRLLYSEEIQKIEFFQDKNEGFPVQVQALESWKDLERSVNIGTGSSGGYHLVAKWPDEEQRAQLINMVSSLKKPVIVNQTMMRMMVDGAKGYLDGDETVEEAAGKIHRQIHLYHAEEN